MKLKKVHIVVDGKKSLCGQDRKDVTYITSAYGWHCHKEGPGYEDTCKKCVQRAGLKHRRIGSMTFYAQAKGA